MTILKGQGFPEVVLAATTAFAVVWFATPVVRQLALRWNCVDRPTGERWAHRVVARLGGIALLVGVLASAAVWVRPDRDMLDLLAGLLLVFLLGVVDDLRRLRPHIKLLWQLAIGCGLVAGGIRIELVPWPWLSMPLTVAWFVFVMNAFNLLDNMDGLAAGIGAIAGVFCAIHAAMAGEWMVATLAGIVSGACAGFLRYNFPPAKIFMGDSGSHLLGLSLAALALMGSWQHSTRLMSLLAVPALVLAVPIFDTCFVTIQRLMNRRHPFVGGTDHVSHRLAILGLSVRQTVAALYAVSAALGAVSLISLQLHPLPVVATSLAVVTGLVLFGRYLSKVKVYRLEPATDAAPSADQAPSATRIETGLLYKRELLEVMVDFCLIACVYVFAHLLRFEGSLSPDVQHLVLKSLPVILVVKLACFGAAGLYRGLWRYLGLSDVIGIWKAVTLGSVCSALALLFLWRFQGFSRAVFFIDWMLTFLAVGGARVAERLLDEWIGGAKPQGEAVLVIGAGDTGAHVVRSLKYHEPGKRRVIGLLDDDVRKHRSRILGAEVLGGRERLDELIALYQVREVLIAINDPPGGLLRHIQRCCEPRGVAWKVVSAGIIG